MKNNANQRRVSQKSSASPIETIKDLGNNLKDTVANDLIGGVASDAFHQILGQTPEKTGAKEKTLAERAERKTIFITKERPLYVEEDERKITERTELILSEIRNIAKEAEGLEKQLGDFSLEETPEAPGIYHFSFFGRILQLLRKARQAIHDAATWLAVGQTRRHKRGLLAGYGYGRGRKSTTAAIHKMLDGEMGASRSGA